MIKYKELVSTRMMGDITFSPLDALINDWVHKNPDIIIKKTHYQLTRSTDGMFSSALIEYDER